MPEPRPRLHLRLLAVVSAELDKLRSLRIALITATATIGAGALVTAALAASAAEQGVPLSPAAVLAGAVPSVQAGMILLGILSIAHEYAGSQHRTTLAAVPDRPLLLAAKTVAVLTVAVLVAAATVGAGLLAAGLVQELVGAPPVTDALSQPTASRQASGAIAYLALIALLGHAVALLVRHLVPALVGMLGTVLILSPLLAGLAEHARWLPDRAGRELYDPVDPVLTGVDGALVLLGWIVIVGAAGAWRLLRRDA